VIVLDASAALLALMNAGEARAAIAAEQLHAPHLIDAEVANGLRRQVVAGHIPATRGRGVLNAWQRLAVTRHPAVPLLDRVWDLRDNASPYDATYVALAEVLGCPLLTADARLGRASGIRCPVTLVPG
jgi:predicted nucleic acid-binding protein